MLEACPPVKHALSSTSMVKSWFVLNWILCPSGAQKHKCWNSMNVPYIETEFNGWRVVTFMKLLPLIIYPQSLKTYTISKLQRMPEQVPNTGSPGMPVATPSWRHMKKGHRKKPERKQTWNNNYIKCSAKYRVSSRPSSNKIHGTTFNPT